MAFYQWRIAIMIELLHLTTFFLIISNKTGASASGVYTVHSLCFTLWDTESFRIRMGKLYVLAIPILR